ncbi:MAG: hypothetical protein J2P21_11700 [Chloracidobacterium sp.]|nr:hypothetical protein [Chloracidobacterium sp.]
MHRVFRWSCRALERMRVVSRGVALILTMFVLSTFGCHNGAESRSAATGVRVITPIPFGELNDGAEYNASGVVPLGDSRFLFCDNHAADALYELDLNSDGRMRNGLIRRPLEGLADDSGDSIDDLEGMTLAEENGRQFMFVNSSLCLKKVQEDPDEKPVRVPSNGLLRVEIKPRQILSAENMPGFRDWLIRNEPDLADAAARKPNEDGLNIEGLAWDRNRHALLFGARSPAPEGELLVIPVKVKDLAGSWTTDNLEASAPIRLSPEPAPDTQGIRSLEYIEDLGSFLVVVGNSREHSKVPFTLYEWDGQPAGALRRLPVSFARAMKPEGLTAGTVGGKRVLLFVDDAGGYQISPLDGSLH